MIGEGVVGGTGQSKGRKITRDLKKMRVRKMG